MRLRRLSTAGIALALALVAAQGTAVAQQQDRVILKNGKDKTIRIKTEDLDGVWYTASGGAGNTVIRWNEIDSIEYGSDQGYRQAQEALAAGRVSDAASQLESMAADAELRPVLRQGVLFHLGLANARLGKADDALVRYRELLEGFPKSRYLLPVGEAVLSIHLAKDDAAGAARALEPVLAAGKAASSDEALQAALDVLRGRLQQGLKKLDEAVSAFERAASNAKADPDVVNAAKLGLARCAQERGQTNDAEKRYRELVKVDAPNPLLAGAWNGLGELALEQAREKRDPDGARVALLSFLRGVVLYVPSQAEPSDEHERSLAGAAKAAKAIGDLEGNAERKQLFLERARQYKGQLTSRYPGSRFLEGL